MNMAETVAQILLEQRAVFFRPNDPFVWTSGIKSPVYCDNRLLISTVIPRDQIIQAFVEKIKPLKIDCIAGTATAGIPWAAWIAQELKLPLIYVRSSAKEHGRQNAIEGHAKAGSRTVLIEDLISTGKSSIAAANKLREQGIFVEKVLSIFTYDFSQAKEIFLINQLSYESLSSFEVLANVAYHNNDLDLETLKNILTWKESVVFP